MGPRAGLEWAPELVWSGPQSWSGVGPRASLEWAPELVWSGPQSWSGGGPRAGLEGATELILTFWRREKSFSPKGN